MSKSESDEPLKLSDLETLRKSVDDAAGVCGPLWLSYLAFALYLALTAGAVTHLDLFLERPVLLPVANINLPLLAFFCVAPALLLIFHAYVLVHFAILSDKARRFRERLGEFERANGEDAIRRNDPRDLLSSNVFAQFMAGPPELRSGAFGWTLRVIAWFTIVIAPVLVLLLLQLQFLPYQSARVTWMHRVYVFVDLALLWWLWDKILSCRRERDCQTSYAISGRAYGACAMALALAFSWFVAGAEDEPMSGVVGVQSLQQAVFRSRRDEESRRPVLPFSNRLVLANVNIAESVGAKSAAWAGKTQFALQARGRNFRGAVFDHAILTKGDFTGAHLEGASFFDSVLDNSAFDRAAMDGAVFTRSTARGASFEKAQLALANFEGADLAQADFVNARLPGAVFDHAGVRGAEFYDADLGGSSLVEAVIFATSFERSNLAEANFKGAEISDSDFTDVELNRARLAYAKSFVANDIDKEISAAVELERNAKIDGVDSESLRMKQAELFTHALCVVGPDNVYIMKGAVFTRMKGGAAIQMIKQILSGDCVTSKSLTDEDSLALRSRLSELEKATREPSVVDCKTKEAKAGATACANVSAAGGFPSTASADK